ncbi:Fe-S cluster assembly ATPase SufC [Salinibacter ruber]|jgi:Fe-S cluster assembly ATP-binding protein|uniref:Fe-S cluster assembly ATP-binding protein n=1 Tax=Salinibacter ruber TaxID=146919 RepID=A0A9X2Q1K6_9BACT|nr:Fe-S cluster assembly ATPase SufC [Salinibacter ruber]MCS3629549.1 Fe-S cluster assembly ATP-binding protein [Salinibacter ruber]MCS3644124.1 Fe-S cluster assembly ATP-binding protein [Salinibacter ruber]MCS3676690.1 Fe-S cluster assembly ATP-binding protein [Salinibacter ruber]MCS3679978.1 Fe-S cluster assembly ATP-binding protein [Salinibacter ruber]MCS3682905.1 Fe-S cluster assembly ATP-binding protein [Salinibacter ruber]
MALLEIENLHVGVEDEDIHILKGVDLTLDTGNLHAIMGPNGSGKSTLASVLAGREEYEVLEGSIRYDGDDLLELEPEERAEEGIFLAFQYPVELPGVSMTNFLKEAVNSVREARGEDELSSTEFLQQMRERADMLGLDADLTKRSVNEGFSGGEKKRNEIFQLAMLEPRLAILDETDSGLDIDALQSVANGVNKLRDGDRGFLVITHYERILQYIVPDRIHVMMDGQIARSGDKDLAETLEEHGYEWIREEVAAAA